MALTPMDIIHKEFSHAMRGYSVEEVDAFLEEVKDELGVAQATLEEAKKRIAAQEQKLAHYVEIESTLNSAFVSAQQSADHIKEQSSIEAAELLEKARAEGERVYREANDKRQTVTLQMENERRKIELEITRLKESEQRFRKEYAEMIAHFSAEIEDTPEIKVPNNCIAESEEESTEEASSVEQEPVVADTSSSADAVEQSKAEKPAVVEEASVEVAGEVVIEGFTATETVSPAEEVAPQKSSANDASDEAPAASPYASYGEVEDDLDIEEID